MLPSRGRPAKAARFLEACKGTQIAYPGVLMTEKRDRDDYAGIVLPEGWVHVEIAPALVSKKYNDAIQMFPNESHYFLMADDCVPETLHWDRMLADAAGSRKIAYGDNMTRPNPPVGHPCIGGDLVRALGWVAHPAFGHFYWDNVLRDIAEGLGDALVYVPEVVTRHLHFTVTGEGDVFERGAWRDDDLMYSLWKQHQMTTEIARVRAALQ